MRLSNSLDEQLNIMTRFGLNGEEYLLIELLLLAIDPDHPDTRYLLKYFNECVKKSLPRDTLQSLKDKKVLHRDYKVPGIGEEFILDDLEFDAKFLNENFKLSYQAGKELFEAYPSYMQTDDGRLYPARNIIKANVESLEAFFYKYAKSIRHSAKTHARVLESLSWAIENRLITYGIAEYVLSRKWEEHIKMIESGDIGDFVVKVNTLSHG